jgi:hypothetical protein
MKDAWQEIVDRHPNVSVDDNPDRRNKSTWLFMMECHPVIPRNYAPETIFQYKGLVTWNRKIIDMYKDSIATAHVVGFPIPYVNHITEFTPFSNKFNATCVMGRYREPIRIDGDIVAQRLSTAEGLQKAGLQVHCYGKVAYGGRMYKGPVGAAEESFPGSVSKLRLVDKYKYTLAFENCYHELYSWDYITEKIFDAFRAKTVPIYYGCYNVEEHIPKELFVDYREFRNDSDLVKYLGSITEAQYTKMVNDAYDFCEGSRWGNINDIDRVFGELK